MKQKKDSYIAVLKKKGFKAKTLHEPFMLQKKTHLCSMADIERPMAIRVLESLDKDWPLAI